MQLLITRKEVAGLAALALGLAAVCVLLLDAAQLRLGLVVVLACMTVAGLVAEVYRRQLAQHDELLAELQQVQAFNALLQLIQPRAPLSLLRSWTAAPDLALYLVGRVLAGKPRTIVELGSGTSTVAMAYALEKIGAGGRIISFEHDEPSKVNTERLLREHGLEGIAKVILAPLQPTSVGGATIQFYDLSGLEGVDTIDFLFVDGPPSFMQPLARYPAVPLLWPRLSAGATVVLDDARRPRELEVGRRWRAEFPQGKFEMAATQRGALTGRKPA